MRFALLALFAGAAWPQEPALVIRTESRLVQMTVVVQDGKGKPVTGLTKDDFTVTDDGKPQTVSIFEAYDGAQVLPAATLPAGHFSNRLEYRGGAPSAATVLLIDLVNSPPGYWGRAKPHLAKFLKQADVRQRLAIYVLSRKGLRRIHDFSSVADSLPNGMSADMQAFLTSIGNPAGARAAILGSGDGWDAVAALIAWSEAAEGSYYTPMEGLQACEALSIMAQRLAGVPGRKNLVWVSTGFARIQGNSIGRISEAFDRAARDLSNASVAVYPVDARGILALTDQLATAEGYRTVRFTGGPTAQTMTMSELASRTEGCSRARRSTKRCRRCSATRGRLRGVDGRDEPRAGRGRHRAAVRRGGGESRVGSTCWWRRRGRTGSRWRARSTRSNPGRRRRPRWRQRAKGSSTARN
jgi:VWFA-related protein